MTEQERDPRCGCPLVELAANRADRRRAKRMGLPAPAAMTLHIGGCVLAIRAGAPVDRRAVHQACRA